MNRDYCTVGARHVHGLLITVNRFAGLDQVLLLFIFVVFIYLLFLEGDNRKDYCGVWGMASMSQT